MYIAHMKWVSATKDLDRCRQMRRFVKRRGVKKGSGCPGPINGRKYPPLMETSRTDDKSRRWKYVCNFKLHNFTEINIDLIDLQMYALIYYMCRRRFGTFENIRSVQLKMYSLRDTKNMGIVRFQM